MITCFRLLLILPVILFSEVSLSLSLTDETTDSHLIGIQLSASDVSRLADGELVDLEQLGIDLIEIEGYPSDRLLDQLERTRLLLFVRQERRFTTSRAIRETDSLMIAEDRRFLRQLSERASEHLVAFSLFTYPNDVTSAGRDILQQYAAGIRLPEQQTLHLYYLSASRQSEYNLPPSFSFRSLRSPTSSPLLSSVIHFVPTGGTAGDLNHFYSILEGSLDMEESIVIIPYSWFAEKLKRYSWFPDLIQRYRTDLKTFRVQPDLPEPAAPVNWDVVLLMLITGMLLVQFRYNPLYRDGLFRYFFSHRYFLDHFISYWLRNISTGLYLFMQHAILTAITLYTVAESRLSDTGIELLSHYLSPLFRAEPGTPWLLVSGFLFAVLIQAVSVLWLHICNRNWNFKQTLTLYSWPLQINLPITFLMTSLFHAGDAQQWIILLGGLFAIVWALAFIITAFDLSTAVMRFRVLFLISTAGIYLLLILFILVMLAYYPPVYEVISMALGFL